MKKIIIIFLFLLLFLGGANAAQKIVELSPGEVKMVEGGKYKITNNTSNGIIAPYSDSSGKILGNSAIDTGKNIGDNLGASYTVAGFTIEDGISCNSPDNNTCYKITGHTVRSPAIIQVPTQTDVGSWRVSDASVPSQYRSTIGSCSGSCSNQDFWSGNKTTHFGGGCTCGGISKCFRKYGSDYEAYKCQNTCALTNGTGTQYGDGSGSRTTCILETCNSGYLKVGSTCQPIINGSCGGTKNTCIAGTVSNIGTSGVNDTWSCDGSNGGSNISCNTPMTYSWNIGSRGSCSGTDVLTPWSTCTQTCGGGTQTRSCTAGTGFKIRVVSCLRSDGTVVSDGYCTETKPSEITSCSSTCGGLTSQSCNTQSCGSCSDGIKNQDEIVIDMGGVCGGTVYTGRARHNLSCSDITIDGYGHLGVYACGSSDTISSACKESWIASKLGYSNLKVYSQSHSWSVAGPVGCGGGYGSTFSLIAK